MKLNYTVLACPKCGEKLKSVNDLLICTNCHLEVPIINEIPRFGNENYVNNFGFEWNIHRTTQIDKKNRTESARHFEVRFENYLKKFDEAEVLDVGVGVGRYAAVAQKYGANVTGVDLSSSVDVAKQNLEPDHCQIIQADLFNLPFAENSFDIIYSFGVLHHTPDPRLGFSKLVKLLKPGGIICITLYEKGSMYHTSRFMRKFTPKIPNLILYWMCALYVISMYIPYRFLGLRYGLLGRLIPISLSSNLSEAILDTFDCYSPQFQFTYTEGDIYKWFKEEGLKEIEFKSERVTVLAKK